MLIFLHYCLQIKQFRLSLVYGYEFFVARTRTRYKTDAPAKICNVVILTFRLFDNFPNFIYAFVPQNAPKLPGNVEHADKRIAVGLHSARYNAVESVTPNVVNLLVNLCRASVILSVSLALTQQTICLPLNVRC